MVFCKIMFLFYNSRIKTQLTNILLNTLYAGIMQCKCTALMIIFRRTELGTKLSKTFRMALADKITYKLQTLDVNTRFRFNELKSDEKRVESVISKIKELNLIPVCKTAHNLKSKNESIEWYNDGNTFVVSNRQTAIECYTKSIASAPYPSSPADSSEELALAFANRSAVNFSMDENDACLKDIWIFIF